jgi:hypothetical protein
VIPREPYPGDIGSHSPFLRIGDRTALDQHTHIHTHVRTRTYKHTFVDSRKTGQNSNFPSEYARL